MQILGDVKGKKGYRKLKEEALDRIVWRTGFGMGYETGVRQSAGGMIRANNVDPESKFKNFTSTVLQLGTVQFSHPYRSISAAMSGNIN